jgi:Integral membrane protein S linking to the trans Golgi network
MTAVIISYSLLAPCLTFASIMPDIDICYFFYSEISFIAAMFITYLLYPACFWTAQDLEAKWIRTVGWCNFFQTSTLPVWMLFFSFMSGMFLVFCIWHVPLLHLYVTCYHYLLLILSWSVCLVMDVFIFFVILQVWLNMAGQFRSSQWDPLLIMAQIVTMQCVFYVGLGVCYSLVDFIVGASRSLDQIFLIQVK